jgi:ankyrin repeat protein
MDSVNLLLSHGADIHLKNPTGNSGLMEIVRLDHSDLLEILYKPYAKTADYDVNEEGNVNLIHLAAGQCPADAKLVSGMNKCLKYLLSQEEFVNQICNIHDKATPLMFAAMN